MIARAIYVLAVIFALYAASSWATGFLWDAGTSAAIAGFLWMLGGFIDQMDRDRMRRGRDEQWARRIRETAWDAEYRQLCDEEEPA